MIESKLSDSDPSPKLFAGLMSGTSLDGIDAVLIAFDNSGGVDCIATHYTKIPTDMRGELLALCSPGDNEIQRLGKLDREFAELMAEAVMKLLEIADVKPAQVRAIGSHGQTIRHCPDEKPPFTIQIGDPNTLAERTGLPVVADFRRRDVAASGQGAPMVPGFHRYCFGVPDKLRLILNIGGFSNLTVLLPDGEVTGYDCGPGNVLMDAWIQDQLGRDRDEDGAWARSGKVLPKLLQLLLDHPFFSRPPPRSTGREEFNLGWLKTRLRVAFRRSPEARNVQATLVEFAASAIAKSVAMHTINSSRDTELFVCGGGALNSYLFERLQKLCSLCKVSSTEVLGLPPEWVEATAFAWLARQFVLGRPGNVPSVTGARYPRVVGMLCPGNPAAAESQG